MFQHTVIVTFCFCNALQRLVNIRVDGEQILLKRSDYRLGIRTTPIQRWIRVSLQSNFSKVSSLTCDIASCNLFTSLVMFYLIYWGKLLSSSWHLYVIESLGKGVSTFREARAEPALGELLPLAEVLKLERLILWVKIFEDIRSYAKWVSNLLAISVNTKTKSGFTIKWEFSDEFNFLGSTTKSYL